MIPWVTEVVCKSIHWSGKCIRSKKILRWISPWNFYECSYYTDMEHFYFIVSPIIITSAIENMHLWRYPMVAAIKETRYNSVSYVVWNICMWKVLYLIQKFHFALFVGYVIQNVSGVHISWVPGHPSNTSLHNHT